MKAYTELTTIIHFQLQKIESQKNVYICVVTLECFPYFVWHLETLTNQKHIPMKSMYYVAILSCLFLFTNCKDEKAKTKALEKLGEAKAEMVMPPKPIFSFSFVGCNRVNWGDVTDSIPSTANRGVLERIFKELVAEKQQTELFFFLGDLVLAESTLPNLDTQLAAWKKLYNANPISTSGIEMVAVPGNHEMLYSQKDKSGKYKEYPLKGTTDIWLKYMGEYMPKNRDTVGGKESHINSMTFSFTRHNTAFIVMNTDTYNPPTKENPYGLEGMVPTPWILNKIAAYQKDETIKHIFLLGHKPYYVCGVPRVDHKGLPEGPVIWPAMKAGGVTAMLSAHVHDYQRSQPGDEGPYQIVAGNGGSQGAATFFGFSTITILDDGSVKLISKGFEVGTPYDVVSDTPSIVRDSTMLTWTKNTNPYPCIQNEE